MILMKNVHPDRLYTNRKFKPISGSFVEATLNELSENRINNKVIYLPMLFSYSLQSTVQD